MNRNPAQPGRCLITTAEEQSWVFDRPVLFLGEWCRPYTRRHVWQAMDAVVAPPYGLHKETRDRDHACAREYESSIFPDLCHLLNLYHGSNHGHRYWRILVGHWLRRSIEVLINRYRTLNECINVCRPSFVTVCPTDGYKFASRDSYEAIWTYRDPLWNFHLYSRLLEYSKITDLVLEEVPVQDEKVQTSNPFKLLPERPSQRVKSIAYRVFDWARIFSRDDDAIILNSYLPRKEEILLHLALGQVPLRSAEQCQFVDSASINFSDRRRLGMALADQLASDQAGVIRTMLFDMIPVCFLEGYAELTKSATALQWPSRPKFIFTSNNFDTDELFKAWVAEKVESGAHYFVGQHGNNYGTSRYMNPSLEELTADKFITWGWTDGLPQHVAGFIFKKCGKPALAWNSNGGLLLIELHAGQMLTTWDSVAEHATYFKEQLNFAAYLQPEIREFLLVRLHHTLKNLGWDEAERWLAFDTSVQLDNGQTPLNKLISNSRLVVHSYDSTGILETLSQNIPTLAFWQNGFDHLRDSALPYYQLLVDVGIVHLSPQSAAAHINTIWDDVDGWWSSHPVQAARIQFCNRYARTSLHPVREMKDILMKEV